ncbi:MAG: DNA repair protein RadA [Acidimicrobiales bacterium]
MARLRTVFRCEECGTGAPKWAGRCPGCGAWNTMAEELEEASKPAASDATGPAERPIPVDEVDVTAWVPRPTGIGELDRVLGGGFVPGSVTLLGGEPGIGKSTLLLQVLGSLAGQGLTCLMVSGEESAQQVRLRAERLGIRTPKLWLLAETNLDRLLAACRQVGPGCLVVDSIQTMVDADVPSTAGSVTQVRECAARLVRLAKQEALAVVLVGHVTKEGGLAGPRVLEHVVDTVLSFEGERHHALRLLRASKHRFGPTTELGLFEMRDDGMIGVPDPGALFLADRRPGIPGSVVAPILDGHRPLLVELQALVTATTLPMPRRSAQGLDGGRVALLAAVLDKRAGVSVTGCDVYALAAGGVKVTEPAADLALALAMASSVTDVAVGAGLVACGEVGLGGELRQVSQTGRRLAEAARLGFTQAIVPESAPEPPPGMEVLRAATLLEALGLAGLGL